MKLAKIAIVVGVSGITVGFILLIGHLLKGTGWLATSTSLLSLLSGYFCTWSGLNLLNDYKGNRC